MGCRRYFDQAVELDQMSGELPTLELMVCPSFPCVLRDRQNRFESCSRFQRVLSALAVPRPYPAKTYEHSARAKSSGACHGGTYGWFFGVPRKGLRLRERSRAIHRKIGRDQAVERVVGNRRIVRRGLGSCGIREGDLTHSWRNAHKPALAGAGFSAVRLRVRRGTSSRPRKRWPSAQSRRRPAAMRKEEHLPSARARSGQ